MNTQFAQKAIVALAAGLVSVAEAAYTETYLNDIAVKDDSGKIVALGTSDCTSGCGLDCAFDDDVSTRVDPAYKYQVGGKSWVGLELTEPKYVTTVVFGSYSSGTRSRINGAQIQGANMADFSDAETLLTISYPSSWSGGANLLTQKCDRVSILKKWKYLRLYTENPCAGAQASSSNTQCGNVNILRFYGGDKPDDMVAPTAPVVSPFCQINWRATFKLNLTEETWIYEFERKGPSDADFVAYMNKLGRQDLSGQYVTGPVYAPFDCDFRVRAVNPAGASDWVTVSVPGHYSLRGTLIGTAGSYYGLGATKEKTVDGDPTTYFDSPKAMGDWAGLDFGSEQKVTAIRYIPRLGVEQRMPGNEFQTSETADFAVSSCVYRVASRPPTGVNEVTLESPVSTRYMRVQSLNTDGGGGHCNVAEFEFVADPEPCAPPTPLTIARQDLTNQYPVLTWAYEGDWPPYALTTCVWRTMSPGGLPCCVGMVPVGQTSFTDTTARVGVEYTYRLTSMIVTNGIPAYGAFSAATAAYRRSRRLERTWEDQTKLCSGCSAIKTGTEYTTMRNLFDGQTATYADMVDKTNADKGNVRAGVDFGELCTFTSFRIYPKDWTGNAGGQARVKNYRVWGSADDSDVAKDSWTNAFEMTEKLVYQLAWTELAATNQGPCRFVFLWKPEGSGFMNLTEFECYGWRASDLSDAPYPAENLAFSSRAKGVQIAWTPRTGCTYRIERRLATGDAYEILATTDAGLWLDTTARQDIAYAYRLVTVKDGVDESATADTTFTWCPVGMVLIMR